MAVDCTAACPADYTPPPVPVAAWAAPPAAAWVSPSRCAPDRTDWCRAAGLDGTPAPVLGVGCGVLDPECWPKPVSRTNATAAAATRIEEISSHSPPRRPSPPGPQPYRLGGG